ncbi:M56 family metallopeptidase [Kitasatospora sp. DSM 101779]|uniref:M56 family metallopeptidase n=1 Tax=Kitasatospora sp. DSM 101779 TaxID=2853165 RepID=UPI0021D81D31|nr:M56 family metallopeptidase [Kitasatospora sp. DSM 101779]MCU7820648.1 M56 family metallopeptidase [Kitasatospora sp. DSM 101779]
MTIFAVLGACTVLAAWWAPARLERAAWTIRSVRTAIALWCALLGFCAMAVAMGLHQLLAGGHSTAWLPGRLTGHHRIPSEGIPGHVEALALAAAVFAVLTAVVAADCLKAARARARHRQLLDLIARPTEDGTLRVDDPRAAAWCVPGRGGRIVLTRGADEQLTAPQLAAVIAHERAHLRGRHHLLVVGARAVGRTLPWLPLTRLAARRIPVLCEMAADDAAVRTVGRDALARALCRIATHSAPEGALAAGMDAAVERVLRLTAPQRASTVAARAAGWVGVVVLPLLPVLIACGP